MATVTALSFQQLAYLSTRKIFWKETSLMENIRTYLLGDEGKASSRKLGLIVD